MAFKREGYALEYPGAWKFKENEMFCSECGAKKVEYVGFNSREGDPGNPWDCVNTSCGEEPIPYKVTGGYYGEVKIDAAAMDKIARMNQLMQRVSTPRILVPNPFGGPSFQGVNRMNPSPPQAPTKSTFTYSGVGGRDQPDHLTPQEKFNLEHEALQRLYARNYAPGHYELAVGSSYAIICDALGSAIVGIPSIDGKDYLIGRTTL